MPPRSENKTPDITQIFKPWLDMAQAKSFLSSEFLLWIWHLAESPTNPLQLRLLTQGENVLVKLWIEDRLVLESTDTKAHVHTLKGGEPSRSREAESALQAGKNVKELRLGLTIEPYGDFLTLLTSKDLAPKSIVLPTGHESRDTAMQGLDLAFRLKMTDLLVDTLDTLFARFLEQRTDSQLWSKTQRTIDEWVASRGHAETQYH